MEERKTEQLSKEQAIAFFDSKLWEKMSYRERAEFQLLQDKLCMPFVVFSEAMSKCLKRSVYTHEFMESNRENLIKELFEGKPAPTMNEILSLLPADKLIVLNVMEGDKI